MKFVFYWKNNYDIKQIAKNRTILKKIEKIQNCAKKEIQESFLRAEIKEFNKQIILGAPGPSFAPSALGPIIPLLFPVVPLWLAYDSLLFRRAQERKR